MRMRICHSRANDLHIFVLASRKNALFLNEAISSICDQVGSLPITVTASLNGDARAIFSEIKPQKRLSIKHREEYLTAESHMTQCIKECTSDYIMLFHDDDLLVDGYLDKAMRIIRKKTPDLILTDSVFFSNMRTGTAKSRKTLITPKTKDQVILLALGGKNINFAGCIYKADNIRGLDILELVKIFGKYADRPTMLSCVHKMSSIIFCQGGTVCTRVHHNQDSQQPDKLGASYRARLLRYYREQLDVKDLRFLIQWPYACMRSLLGEAPMLEVFSIATEPFKGKKLLSLPLCMTIGTLKIIAERAKAITATALSGHSRISTLMPQASRTT